MNNLNQHIFFQKIWKRDQGELILVFKKRSSYITRMSNIRETTCPLVLVSSAFFPFAKRVKQNNNKNAIEKKEESKQDFGCKRSIYATEKWQPPLPKTNCFKELKIVQEHF